MATKILSEKVITSAIKQELLTIQPLLDNYFSRVETKGSAFAYVNGLVSLVERKNSWQLAEQEGFETPYAFQHLLGRALWDAEGLREEVCRYTVKHLGVTGGVLSIDETGFLKKGDKSAGVKRQYSGTAGRIENCQIGVFLSYATHNGRALIDRELYIPQEWFDDKKRCDETGIPKDRCFKTKPDLAKVMLERVLQTQVKPAWVVGDEVYGCGHLRQYLEEEQQAYVLGVACNYSVAMGLSRYQVQHLLEKVSTKDWKLFSVGAGTKGQRYYQWYRLKINSLSPSGWSRWLLFRRHIKKPEEVAYYIGFCADKCSLESMCQAAGTRWTIEECFEMAKGEVGLDQYEVRSFTGWYRHMTFALLALSLLVKLREQLNEKEFSLLKKKATKKQGMKTFLKNRGLD